MVLARANLSFYRAVLTLARPLVRLRLWLRARKEPEYGERVEERFGAVPADVRPEPIWFHTVSAGESIAAMPLIEAVLKRFPAVPVLVTTMTPTGSGEVTRRLGGRVDHCYAPYDFTSAVTRFYDRVKPRALVLMETELWPNLIRLGEERRIPVMLVNARLSERSARGYERIGALARRMLGALELVACQTEAHRQRFEALGAANVAVAGSVKFDVELTDEQRAEAQRLRSDWGLEDRPVWVVGSTHPGEDEMVLAAFARLRERFSDACLVLVPRHPVRSAEVLALAENAGFTAHLQSALQESAANTSRVADVVVGDTMGTLMQLFGLAQVAMVGGSLVERGGHNPIEAALWGLPIIMGPHVFNFAEVVDEFEAAHALRTVSSAESLAETVLELFDGEQQRREMGQRALSVVDQHRGALARQIALLEPVLTRVVQGEENSPL